MMLRSILTVALALTLAACSSEPGDRGTSATIIECGALIDGISSQPRYNQVITIVGERITLVDAGPASASNVIDLSDYTCMPGLIDTHSHMVEDYGDINDLSVYFTRKSTKQQEIATVLAARTLDAGFTTIRNLAAYDGFADVVLRNRINNGEIPGPRMQASGYYLTIPGGGGDLLIPDYDESSIPARVRMGIAQGPEEFRRKAQGAIAGGADVLKIIASGAVLAFGGVPGAPEMTPAEIEAVVEVAHAANLKVTAHAHSAQSIKEAILAGVDSIEHASLADDEAIALALEHDVAFSMDIYNGTFIATVGREEGWSEEFLRKNDETTEAQRQVFTRAHAAGVPIIYGTDAGVFPHGDNGRMFAYQVEHGMTPMEALQSATSVAATHIGWAHDVGAIEPGRFGDIIAVRGNPLDDISLLEHPEVVIKGGQRIK